MLLILIWSLLLAYFAHCQEVALYSEVQVVNRSDSFQRGKALPVVYYKFLYDSVPERVQLGVIGTEAQRLFPESIEVLPSTAFSVPGNNTGSSIGRNTPIIVTNFPVVDKNVLFMHGLVAVQELIHLYDDMHSDVDYLGEKDRELREEFLRLQNLLNNEAKYQTKAKLASVKREVELVRKQLFVEMEKHQNEMERAKNQIDEEKALLQYEEKLARERLIQQEEITKQATENQLQMERALADKKEFLQRQNAAALQALKQSQAKVVETKRLEYEKEKIRAEIEARSQQDRINEEIAIRKIQTQSKLDTERMVEGIKSISMQISAVLKDILSRPQQLGIIAGILLLLITCYFLIREFSSMIRQFVQMRIGKPNLVRETSYHWSLLPPIISNIWTERQELVSSKKTLVDEFKDIILSDNDKQRVLNLALATRNTRKSGAPYRHILLHGPPGTGKTLIARRLAKSSGMDYAILSGGDIAPLGEDAVSQLHALFRWAQSSSRGLLVFIDEAEAFLSSRSNSLGEGAADAHIRNALNALLYQTGTPSKTFMMVLATNRPEDLDAAILDRIDVSIQVSLPQKEQRVQLVKLYFDRHVLKVANASSRRGIFNFLGAKKMSVKDDCCEEENILSIARELEGFSGREISKLFISVQYAMF